MSDTIETIQRQIDEDKDAEIESLFQKVLVILNKPPSERTSEQIDLLMEVTKDFGFFQKMNAKKSMRENDAHRKCCRRLKLERYPQGTIVFREGDAPDKFYIVLRGSVNVLLHKEPHQLQEEIAAMKAKYTNIYKRALDTPLSKEGIQKVKLHELSTFDQRKLVQSLDKEISYPLQTGGVEVKDIQNIEHCFQDGVFRFVCVATIGKGNIFGELGLILKKTRAATIMVQKEAEFGTMSKLDYEDLLLQMEKTKFQTKIKFFRNCLPSDISKEVANKFSYIFEKKKYQMNHDIFKPKEEADGIYFIKSGEVLLYELENTGDDKHASDDEIDDERKNPMFRTPKPTKLQANRLPLQTLGEGQYFGDEDLFEENCERRYGAVCISADSRIYFTDKTRFLQLVNQQPILSEFFRGKASLKKLWHGEHIDFLHSAKEEVKKQAASSPEKASKSHGRITSSSLEQKVEKYMRTTASPPKQTMSALPRADSQQTFTTTTALLTDLLNENTTHYSSPKKRRTESVRTVRADTDPDLDDSMVKYDKYAEAYQKYSEAASKTANKGPLMTTLFQRSGSESKTLTAAEVLERKMKAQVLDKNRHYREIWGSGVGTYQKVCLSAMKQLSKATRPATKGGLNEFRIGKAEIQSREGNSIQEKARKSYSLFSFTGTSWRKGGKTNELGTQTQPDARTPEKKLRIIPAQRASEPRLRTEPYEKESNGLAIITLPTQPNQVDEVHDSLFGDNSPAFDSPWKPDNSFLTDHKPEVRKSLMHRAQSSGKFERCIQSRSQSRGGDLNRHGTRIQLNHNTEVTPLSTQEMAKMLSKMKFQDKAFVGLSENLKKRKGDFPTAQPVQPKTQAYYLTWGRGVSVIKGGIESGSLRTYVQEANHSADRGNKKQNTSHDSFIQKKLRKTKHNMFRFQHNKLHF